jgi:hypothetical protein
MRNPQSSKEGHLLVDHRASPGLDPEIARRMGYEPEFCREGKLYEQATLTCCHCTTIMIKNPERTRPRENCPKCDHSYLCDYCYAASQRPDYVHNPMVKQRDDLIDRAYHQPEQFLPLQAPRIIIP